MATYIVGDIQGCYQELIALLAQAHFDPATDELWVAGDLVARGPQSLQTLRYIKSLGQSAQIVLGNHDLHLLAVAAGIMKGKKKDLTQAIFDAPDRDELLDWLRQQPLVAKHPQHGFYMVHAGISPQWQIQDSIGYSAEVSRWLAGNDYLSLLEQMYQNTPDTWSDALTGIERARYIINACTRMRYCYPDGRLDFGNKDAPAKNTHMSLKPWFEIDTNQFKGADIMFGHWAALMGKTGLNHIIGLDTGCVWGNQLTMLRWQDKQLFHLPCPV
ncbi:symmetrical bis(5'-nucleosyl)-tetraphosphatase [Motilimonas pumila]|uniref:Bis(5'-nucleosyl)-tetraphosphatase, symmetrical n=1 Tax=Motilimonas pumila TaxID=2303987 RepID=A0A418YAC7_9GAMM|nr:symmetrical bis(5'-nucleosyl)-tetraphosphatase [Motilimonas pumila]RJG39471.1 symmetrical bis(5'-nucleosyl)-tetraphosphatase [Motilimonas pumila]